MSRKCTSSIPSSFASIYLISAFFAISFFSLLYIKYPKQINNIEYLKIIAPTKSTPPPFLINDFTLPSFIVNDHFKVVSESSPSLNSQFSPSNQLEEVTDDDLKHENEDEDEDEHENESTFSEVDHISYPPSNFTKEQRMEWIKQKLPESRILESTPKTRKFDIKIQQFVRTKRCKAIIFLTWISPTRLFGKREMFSLESILKAHPNSCVIIISRIMGSKQGKTILKPLLEQGYLILTVAPDFHLIFNGTPAQDWLKRLENGQLAPGKIPITQKFANLLRLAILYKYGGIYFDTDMIILKDVSGLRNSIGIQEFDEEKKTWISVNNAVLIFDKNHPLLFKFMEEFNSSFDGSLWGHNGPYMATRIIKEVINDPKYQFNVMSPMAFYPISWQSILMYYRNSQGNDSEMIRDMFGKISKESYGVHLWNKISWNTKIQNGSVIGRLISDHCILCQDVYG